MGRSSLLVLAYLGCLKAGLAYMPLERSLPRDRLCFMVKEARCNLVLTASTCPISDIVNCIDLLESIDLTENTPVTNLPHVSSSQLCNLMFTSGSTGLPKGVMIEHRGMVNVCAPASSIWKGRARTAFTTGVAFDPAGMQIFGSLANGSEIHVLQDSGVFSPEQYIK